jgi:hypothetical protein
MFVSMFLLFQKSVVVCYCGGAVVDARTISSGANSSPPFAVALPGARMRWTAASAIAWIGWRRVVSGGSWAAEKKMSSMPISEKSCGRRLPSCFSPTPSADRHHVVDADRRRRPAGGAQQARRRAASQFEQLGVPVRVAGRVGGVGDHQFAGHAGLGDRLLEAFQAVLPVLREGRRRHQCDRAVAQRHQVFHRHRRGGRIVDRQGHDAVVAFVRALDVEGHHRTARRHGRQVVGVVQRRTGDDALGAIGQQVGHHGALALRIAEGTEGHHMAVVTRGGRFHRAGQRTEELVGQRGHQQADHRCHAGLELARRAVGPVAQLLDRLLDLLLRIGPHLFHAVVEEIRDAGGGYTGQSRHIPNFWFAHDVLVVGAFRTAYPGG